MHWLISVQLLLSFFSFDLAVFLRITAFSEYPIFGIFKLYTFLYLLHLSYTFICAYREVIIAECDTNTVILMIHISIKVHILSTVHFHRTWSNKINKRYPRFIELIHRSNEMGLKGFSISETVPFIKILFDIIDEVKSQ